MKMPSLSQKALQSSPVSQFLASGQGGDARSSGVWRSSNTDDVSLCQLHKFWSDLSAAARRELLRIDKQTLFEQVRKNLYCSRCHGLLVEGFTQIVMYGKSLQAGMVGYSNGAGNSKQLSDMGTNSALPSLQDDTRDPSVHPWGGLAATRDSMLTVLDCFLDGTPLEVFESARARERERELLYPDACGGGGRGWISQNGGFGGSGRGHGMKETCALHTARLSCEALVDFWSALGDETRRSLLRMKEEDFIERLMFRFDSKRFCRDCRRNVLREFKEMKELKRSRREPRCTRWFCAADTGFRYEVSESVVQVDWRDCFAGDVGSIYQRFEWALGTGEGKCDIMGFEDVGLAESVQVDGLDLASTSACFVTVRGCRRDGRCTELSAKAHALRGQLCVHRRLIVGDGYVSITKGESIQRFFERAEETEEEEDEDSIDKDGNDFDGEGSRPQKHAKSPELARDFLLDAATVIFKEQVEKAFREGTARQNAHSIFVCLALRLLEERVRVACKEITTLEKQNKLLEEEEYEKREEEERRERRKLKEKEKKLRRKEKLKGKDKGNKGNAKASTPNADGFLPETSLGNEEERESSSGSQVDGNGGNHSEDSMSARPSSPDMVEARPSADGFDSENGDPKQHEAFVFALNIEDALNTEDALSVRDGNGAFIVERSKSAKRRSQIRKGQSTEVIGGSSRRGSGSSSANANGAHGNPARVAPAPSLEPISHDKRANLQGYPKNGVWRNDTEPLQKRVEGWTQAHPHSAHLRPEEYQPCACGTPQTGLRSKGGQRSTCKVVGVWDSSPSSNKMGERVGMVDPTSKLLPKVGNFDPGPSQDKGEGLERRPGTVPSPERKEIVDVQERTPFDLSELQKQAHPNASSDPVLSMSNGFHGGRSTCNGAVGHTGSLTIDSGSGIGRHTWTPRVASCSTVITSNGFVERNPAILSVDRGSENGNGKSHPVRITRPRSAGTPSPQVTLLKTAGADAAGCLESSARVSPVSGTSTAADVVRPNHAQGPKMPIQILSRSLSDGGQGTCIRPVSSATAASKLHTPSNPLPAHSGAGLGLQSSFSSTSESGRGDGLRTGSVEAGGRPLQSAVPEQTQASASMTMATESSLQPPDADPGLIHSTIPLGSVPMPPPHLHTNGHPPQGFPQGCSPRPPKGMFVFTEMMSPQGPMPSSMQLPTMPMNPGNVPPQQSFGYYQVQGPWAARSRNGVLPLPQHAGYLIPGPMGLGLSMGGLPSISMPVPASLQPAPLGLGVGRLPSMPNGLNPGMFRESVFLTRFNSRASGINGRGSALLIPGLPLSQHEAVLSVEPGHSGEGHLSPRESSATLSAPLHKDSMQLETPVTSDILGFSLFHSGWPVSAAQKEVDTSTILSSKESVTMASGSEGITEKGQCRGGLDEQRDGVDKRSSPPGEYSLFASAPNKGFGFF